VIQRVFLRKLATLAARIVRAVIGRVSRGSRHVEPGIVLALVLTGSELF
jgi:hypothetical protein